MNEEDGYEIFDDDNPFPVKLEFVVEPSLNRSLTSLLRLQITDPSKLKITEFYMGVIGIMHLKT